MAISPLQYLLFICPSQQTIIRLPWVRFFLERSHNGIRCYLDKTIPTFYFQMRILFHFSFTKSFTICNYSMVIIPHTNQGTQLRTTNYKNEGIKYQQSYTPSSVHQGERANTFFNPNWEHQTSQSVQ